MTPAAAPSSPQATAALCFLCTLLIPCAMAGLALINAGLGRPKNVSHSMLSALAAISLASIAYFAVGFMWQGFPGGSGRVWWVAGKAWDWLGSERPFFGGVEFDGSPRSLAALFGMFAAGVAALIPLGAAAERWRLGAICVSTALFASLPYPWFAHWAWGGGWLAQLGVNYGLGRGFVDSGGAGSIHAVGGLTALAMVWILGPRQGKYHPEGMPAAMPAHNVAFVLFGCFLAWLGFLGLDCAGAFLFSGIDAGHASIIPVNATLAAASAVLAAIGITRARFGRTDASICANAWVAGLVASAAGCAVIRPAGAVLAGLIGGALVVFSVEWLDVYLKVDDPGGVISVHGLGGLWGALAAGLFAQSGETQWLAQMVGVATLIGFVLPVAYGSNWLLDRVLRQRIDAIGERQGLDLYELGAGAYPDFVTHNEEF